MEGLTLGYLLSGNSDGRRPQEGTQVGKVGKLLFRLDDTQEGSGAWTSASELPQSVAARVLSGWN